MAQLGALELACELSWLAWELRSSLVSSHGSCRTLGVCMAHLGAQELFWLASELGELRSLL
eukprot:1160709-Pelagomonas_calceolata.AAC.10